MSQFDFDQIIDRKHSSSLKWDKYKGKDILPLWVADMDFASSPAIVKALQDAVDHQIFGYTNVPLELNELVVQRMKDMYGWEIDSSWIVWMSGMVPGLNISSRAYGDEGSEVLTPAPVYPPFLTSPGNFNKKLVKSQLVRSGEEWVLDFDDLEAKANGNTSMLQLCSPHNPVGRVWNEQELTRLAEISEKNDMVIISDEIHCELVIEKGLKHIPIATLSQEVADRTVTLMAPSKTFNIAGFGCSFAIISNEKLRHKFKRAQTGIVPDPPGLGIYAALAAYKDSHDWHSQLLDYLRGNRDYLLSEFSNIPAFKTNTIEATYLAWLEVTDDSIKKPVEFFEKAGVGLSDGTPFGSGSRYLRLNFGCPRATLEEGIRRIKSAF